MKTNRARMISTTSPAVMLSLSLAHERGGAPDLEHVHMGSGLDDFVVVVGAGGPDLAPQLHASLALGVGDPLDDDRGLPHERGGARPDLPAGALVRARDGTQRGEQ